MLTTIIIFILILSFVVLVHEFGHFIFAKKCGVKVKEFGIGFPPRITKLFTWQGTDFTLNWLILGGFCSMEGELSGEETAATSETAKDKNELSGSFDQKKSWQKFLIVFAGPGMNFILGALAFIIIFSTQGIPVAQKDRVFLESIEPDSPAATVGLQAQTQILTVESSQSGLIKIVSTDELADFITSHRGELIEITTSGLCDEVGVCAPETFSTQVYLRTLAQTPANSGSLGITMSQYRTVFYPWYKQIPLSVRAGFNQSFQSAQELISGLFQGLSSLFHRQKSNLVVMGPVGIVSQLDRYQTFQAGWLVILQFIGILSINLGVMNLLPLPALDGGRIILIFLEKIFGRAKIARLEKTLNYFGFLFLLLLTLLVTGQDIFRIFQGG